jgi:hypothetical protein
MNSKQIYHKYLETLWEVIQNEYLVMIVIPNSYRDILICKKEDWRKIALEKVSSQQVYQEPKHINSLEDLINLSEQRKGINLKTSISNIIYQAFASSSLYDNNDLTIYFNKKIILNLLNKIERKDDKLVFDNLKNLFIQNCEYSKTYWIIVEAVKEKYGEEKAIEVFNSMPSNIDSFSRRDKLKEYILKAFSNIEKRFGKNCHQLILNFVNNRAKQASISQVGSVDLREALIEFYSGEPNLLEDYKGTVPSIKKYLEQTEDGDFFLQKSPRVISRVIDLEEFKAVTSIRANLNSHYLELIQKFLTWYKIKDKRAVNVDASISRPNKKDMYISVFVISTPKNPLPEHEFDIKLKAFAKMLNKINPSEPSDIEHLMDKWWDADELDRQLSSSSTKKSTKTKI